MIQAAIAIGRSEIVVSIVLFAFSVAAVLTGGRAVVGYVRRQQRQFVDVLQGALLLEFPTRLAMLLWLAVTALLALNGYLLSQSVVGAFIGAMLGALAPSAFLKVLRRRRLAKLEEQLVMGIQTLASGVRAGLNLVQAIGLVARDGPVPLRQEFSHLLREYEYGLPLEEAFQKSAARVGSGDFRLLFAALATHRERGGDLGETLDRIAESIREIQRLENRVKTLTAQGRANARMMTGVVVAAMGIYYLMDPDGVRLLFEQDVGRIILGTIILLNVAAFLWIKKIVSIDI